MDFPALKTFLTVAETGSFTRAAQELKQPRSRVSRAVKRLEEDLNTQLLQRTTRQTRLTESGRQLFDRIQPLVQQLEQEIQAIELSQQTVQGTIKVSAPEEFGREILLELLPPFQRMYPQVQFDVRFSNHYVDFFKADLDFALRIGRLQDSALMQRKLGNAVILLVATPEYIAQYGDPRTLEELRTHRLLYFQNENLESENVLDSLQGALPPEGICTISNRFDYLHALAMHHEGIATLPHFYARKGLETGKLVRVLPQWSNGKRPIQVVYPSLHPTGYKYKVFLDYLVEHASRLFS